MATQYKSSLELQRLQDQALHELEDRIFRLRKSAAFLPEVDSSEEEL